MALVRLKDMRGAPGQLDARSAATALKERMGHWPSPKGLTTKAARLGAKRAYRNLRRKAKRDWVQHFPDTPLPSANDNVAVVAASEVWIVVPPGQAMGAVTASAAGASADVMGPDTARGGKARDAMGGFLYSVLTDSPIATATATQKSSPTEKMRMQRGSSRKQNHSTIANRVTYLDSLGVVLLQNLTVEERTLLEDAGADVLPNVTFSLTLPPPPATGSARIKARVKQHARSGSAGYPATVAKPPSFWHLAKINHSAAVKAGLDGRGTRVGILDTGINPRHPEFSGTDIRFREFNRLGRKTGGAVARDLHWHGTHVAALAAGKAAGVAQGADIAMAAVLTNHRIDPETGQRVASGEFAQILAGLNWLLNEDINVDVINLSLTLDDADPRHMSQINKLRDLIVNQARDRDGILTVAAIGNDGKKNPGAVQAPGKWAEVIGVGATDVTDTPEAFSVYNAAKPDLYAPGVDVASASGLDNNYIFASGTSMAAPLVAGTICLLIQKQHRGQSTAEPAGQLGGTESLRKALMSLTSSVVTPSRGTIQRLDLSKI